MKFPDRPNSILARIAISGLGLWAAFSIGFVLFNRYRNGADWDNLTDLFLLAIALPVGASAAAIASWAAGRRAAAVLILMAIIGTAAIGGRSLYVKHLESEAIESSIRQADEDRRRLEAKYGSKCARYKGTENRYAYSICLEKQERDAQKRP